MAFRSSHAPLALALAIPAFAWFAWSQEACTVLSNDALPDEAGIYDGGEAGPDAGANCTACVAGACSGEWSACATSPDCAALLECVEAPGCDATCQAACACATPAGVPLYAAALRCDTPQRCTGGACNAACAASTMTATCSITAPACGAVDAGSVDASASDAAATDAGTAAPVTAATCSACISGNCGDPLQQCPTDSDCALYLACAVACASATCITDCGTAHSTGKQAAVQLAQCATTSCTPQCGY